MKYINKSQVLIAVLSLVIAVVALLVSVLAFVSNSITDLALANDLVSIYEETDYDYILRNPSTEQIESFKTNPSIKKVVPYYQLLCEFEFGHDWFEVVLTSIDDLADINCTEFSTERLVEEQEFDGNKIFLDYSLTSKYGIKLGDTLTYNTLQFVVAGFYQNYNAEIAFVPNLKNLVSKPSYTGVYIEVQNQAQFESGVLQSYKPLATLKDRESFTDDVAYQQYLDDFNNRDFSSYITVKNNGYTDAKESFDNKVADAKSKFLLAGIISGLIVLVGTISLSVLFIKNIRYEVVDGARKGVLTRYTVGGIASLVGIVLTWFVSVGICIATQTHFITLANVLSAGLVSLVVPVVCAVVGTIANLIIVQSKKK